MYRPTNDKYNDDIHTQELYYSDHGNISYSNYAGRIGLIMYQINKSSKTCSRHSLIHETRCDI